MYQDKNIPYQLFQDWFSEARALNLPQYDAMVLATATKDAVPSARMVLFKGLDKDRFCFYTNLESRKGQELLENPQAHLLFYWSGLDTGRQIRVEGKVFARTRKQVEEYFHSRHPLSQAGAIVSQQSRTLDSYSEFVEEVEGFSKKYTGKEIPLPEHWGGFGLEPVRFEFWKDRPNRLHERWVFEKRGDGWEKRLLYP